MSLTTTTKITKARKYPNALLFLDLVRTAFMHDCEVKYFSLIRSPKNRTIFDSWVPDMKHVFNSETAKGVLLAQKFPSQ